MIADVFTYCAHVNQMRYAGQGAHIVRTPTAWYKAFISNDNLDVYYTKSTNKGLSWNKPVAIKATISAIGLAVWYDGWTVGDAGTNIHFTYFDTVSHDVFYRALDISSDTLGTEATVFNGASLVGGAATCLSITKSRGGYLFVAFDIDGGTETGFYRSTDAGATFGARTDMNETTSDYYHLFPGNYADTNDIDCIYWDRSADEISLKTYDDSANSWTEASIATSMADVITTTVCPQFAGAVRPSDGHIIMSAWSASDTLNADLRCWDINGSGSITEVTNVVLNSVDDQGCCAVSIDSGNNYLYVFYLGKSDGSETAYTALNVYYKVSQDGGTTWSAETLLSANQHPFNFLQSSLLTSNGEICVMMGSNNISGMEISVSANVPNKQSQYQIGL